MNSSYFALPGRGGASAGRPPAQCGRVSLMPAPRWAFMVPQPPKPQANSARPTRAKRREPVDIGGGHNSTRNYRREFPGRHGMLTAFYGRRFDVEGGIFQYGKRCSLPGQGLRYQNTVLSAKARDQAGEPIVMIDNMTRLRRHAALIHGRKNSAMLTARAG